MWVLAFAAMVSFMGIGLVDPILKPIAANLGATPSQVSLLFTSYLLVTAFAMLITSFFSSRLGGRTTLIIGLCVIILFSSLAGTSTSVAELVGWRAGWGFGNALFIATCLAAIIAVARGGAEKAITLYEAALGVGISVGPLLGAFLGTIGWRLPFFGVAVLMALALVAISLFLKDRVQVAHRVPLSAPLKALGHGGLLIMGICALLYNGGFFAVLAFTPFAIPLGTYGIGFMFFGWGVLVGIFAVWGAPWMHARFGLTRSFAMAIGLFTLLLVGMAVFVDSEATMIVAGDPVRDPAGRPEHPVHRDGDEHLAGAATGRLGRLQLRPLPRRRRVALHLRQARGERRSVCAVLVRRRLRRRGAGGHAGVRTALPQGDQPGPLTGGPAAALPAARKNLHLDDAGGAPPCVELARGPVHVQVFPRRPPSTTAIKARARRPGRTGMRRALADRTRMTAFRPAVSNSRFNRPYPTAGSPAQPATTSTVSFAVTPGCSLTVTECEPMVLM